MAEGQSVILKEDLVRADVADCGGDVAQRRPLERMSGYPSSNVQILEGCSRGFMSGFS